jgi:hypothetical protein
MYNTPDPAGHGVPAFAADPDNRFELRRMGKVTCSRAQTGAELTHERVLDQGARHRLGRAEFPAVLPRSLTNVVTIAAAAVSGIRVNHRALAAVAKQ